MEALQTPDTFDQVHEEFYISDVEEMDKYDYERTRNRNGGRLMDYEEKYKQLCEY